MATIKSWGAQICHGLNFLHTNRIIHRNLKLQTIFYDAKEARLKIGDFSVSKILNPTKGLPKRKKGLLNPNFRLNILGTPNRMAPEYFGTAGYDEKVDIWAFGLCLLEIATRSDPFDEFKEKPAELEQAIINV